MTPFEGGVPRSASQTRDASVSLADVTIALSSPNRCSFAWRWCPPDPRPAFQQEPEGDVSNSRFRNRSGRTGDHPYYTGPVLANQALGGRELDVRK
jgi:hypothetical protein